MFKDELKETERKVRRDVGNSNNKVLSDVATLKTDIVDIAIGLRDAGLGQARVATDYVTRKAQDLKTASNDAVAKAEAEVKARPGRSVAIAVAVGLLASLLLARRSRPRAP